VAVVRATLHLKFGVLLPVEVHRFASQHGVNCNRMSSFAAAIARYVRACRVPILAIEGPLVHFPSPFISEHDVFANKCDSNLTTAGIR